MKRRQLTETQRTEIWERLASGESALSIARAYGLFHNSIRQMQLLTGGAKPRARTQRPGSLSPAEREEISRAIVLRLSCRTIALRLGRAPSTISRELERNGGVTMYRAHSAQRRANRQARRPKPAKLAECRRLRAVVESKLALKWSPAQISRWLPIAFPGDGEMRVSHETIYMSLFVQGRGALRGKVERLHQSLKRFLSRQPGATSLASLQAQLDAFRLYYNESRPHRALDGRTPAQAFDARVKAGPAVEPASIQYRVRHDRIDKTGSVTLRYRSRLRHIRVGAAHRNKAVRIFVAGAQVRIVTEDHELLRALTLDPMRDYQPLNGRSPVHNVLGQASGMS